jgi:hypothetical protein
MLSPQNSEHKESGDTMKDGDPIATSNLQNDTEIKNSNTLEPEPARDVTSASIHPDEVCLLLPVNLTTPNSLL